jgi:hypothetical protein
VAKKVTGPFKVIDGVECYDSLAAFIEAVPELQEKLKFWRDEIGHSVFLSKSKTNLLCRVRSPFDEFKFELCLELCEYFRHHRTKNSNSYLEEALVDVVNKVKGKGQNKVYFVGTYAVSYWSPGMKFHVHSKRQDHSDVDLDKCFLLVCDDCEKVWLDLTNSVPFFLAAKATFEKNAGG